MQLRRKFYHYVIPSMLAFALSGVYAIVDGFFVGNSIGDYGLAAINIAYPVTAFIQAAGTGIGMGGAVWYSLSDGAGHKEERNGYFKTAVLLLFLASVLLTAVFYVTKAPLLRLFGAEGEIFTLSEEYLRFIVYGTLFQVMSTGMVPFIRNMGGSLIAMGAMIAGFVTNIVLDWLLVWVFPYGMTGAALATVIGQAVTLFTCAGFLFRRRKELAHGTKVRWNHKASHVLSVALSPFGLTFVPNVTLILINKNAMLYGGDAAVSCYAAVSYISCVVFLLLQGISDGGQPLISVFHGEGDLKSAYLVRNMGYRLSLFTAGLAMVLLFLVRGQAALLFGASAQTAETVGRVLPIFLSGYLFVGITRITVSCFYAAGRNRRAYLLIYGEPVFLFFLLLVLPRTSLGLTGTWLSVPLSQILVFLLCISFLLADRQSGALAAD